MKILTILGELLPVFGTVSLLGLWLYQQTRFQARSEKLQKFSGAVSVYQLYQSHNAIFNAINELLKESGSKDQLHKFQVYNYELGLKAIEDVLPDAEKKDIPTAPNAYLATNAPQEVLDRTQTRLEALQQRIAEVKSRDEQSFEAIKRKYLWCYLALSLISVIGAVCKGIVTLLKPAS